MMCRRIRDGELSSKMKYPYDRFQVFVLFLMMGANLMILSCHGSGSKNKDHEENPTSTPKSQKSDMTVPIDMRFLRVSLGQVQIEVDSKTGGGIFNITIDCDAVVVSNKCSGLSLEGLKVGLGVDAFDGSPSEAECRKLSLIGSEKSTVQILEAGQQHSTNGGLKVGPLYGPVPLYAEDHKDLLVALTGKEVGCKYMSLKVNEPSQQPDD